MKSIYLSFLALVVAIVATLVVAPRRAEAGCATASVCSFSGGRRVCSSNTQCTVPRARVCSARQRCTPQRSCSSHSSRYSSSSSCITRNVCRMETVCL
jgi:hypothetical protein